MLGLSETKICYAIGNAAWGAKSCEQGLPIVDHFEPEPVIDAASAPLLAQSTSFPDGRDSKIGTMYYVTEYKIPFTPAHSILMLDKFFENTAAGATPDYTRNYLSGDIRPEPLAPFLNIWKRLKKTGWDRNGCWYNGIVTGISISKTAGQPLLLGARCAFGKRDLTVADPNLWTINRTDGNVTPPAEGSIRFFCGTSGGTLSEFKVPSFNFNLSCDFTPHFWSSQYPDAFTRGKVALTGDFQLRDIVNQIELMTSYIESSTVRSIIIQMGDYMQLRMNTTLISGGASEDEITRNGKYGIGGITESAATEPSAFALSVIPSKEYIVTEGQMVLPETVPTYPVEGDEFPINEPIPEEV